MILLLELFLQFTLLALVAFGGASALLPEIHRVVVDQHHWINDATFMQLFAIAQAAPGPNVLIVSLVGWEIAGVPGAVVATLGMCLPMSLVISLMMPVWNRMEGKTWQQAVQFGVAPLAVGLVLSSGFLIGQSSQQGGSGIALVVLSTALARYTALHPLWLIALGGVCGGLGWV